MASPVSLWGILGKTIRLWALFGCVPMKGHFLTLKCWKYSGDGVFTLSPVDRADESLPSYSGRRYTQRGTPDDVDAVVWQLVANGGGPIFNFLYESGRLVMLNDTCGKIDGALFWRRTDIRKGVRI